LKSSEAIRLPFVEPYLKIKKEKDEDAEQTINNDRINFGDL
jgi:hypothetical protein